MATPELSDSISRAYSWIRERIFDGRLPAGQELQEKLLGEAIGVSRTPVRSALARLHAEGLVTYERYRRYAVAALDGPELDRIFELRVMLEGLAARHAALHITDDEIAELIDLEEKMEAAIASGGRENKGEFDRLNASFHKLILQAARHPRLEAILSSLVDMPLALLERYIQQIEGHLRRSCQHHRELIAAFERRNPDWAEAQMRAHLLSVLRG